jgi:hypothetical protein
LPGLPGVKEREMESGKIEMNNFTFYCDVLGYTEMFIRINDRRDDFYLSIKKDGSIDRFHIKGIKGSDFDPAEAEREIKYLSTCGTILSQEFREKLVRGEVELIPPPKK